MPLEHSWNNLGTGFLKFNSQPPRVHILSDDTEFDRVFLKHLRQEGFDVNYLAFTGEDVKGFKYTIQHLADELELGQSYAMIAFGEAATHALSIAQKPLPHCIALITYYPTLIPAPSASYPTQLSLLVHLASNQPFAPAFKSYVYPDTLPGFAEMDLEEWDQVAAGLAWSRTLGVLREGFGIKVDLEEVLDESNAYKQDKDARMTMSMLGQVPYVNNVPTMTGGVGRTELDRFYRQFFFPGNPPSLKLRLLSRTIGIDKVVDEIMVSFRHTKPMPWILPEVPPTNKAVQIPVVSIVTVRGGRLVHEHLYWDQASVLVQIGLLNPALVPSEMKKKGLQRLPITGREAAEKVLDLASHPTNELISAWAEDGSTTEATDA